MEQTKQPSTEILKKTLIVIHYICNEKIPSNGFKRIQYYTELPKIYPNNIYLGTAYINPENPHHLKRLINQKRIIPLSDTVVLPFDQDIWLDHHGNVRMMDGLGEPSLQDGEDNNIILNISEFQ
jgi:hypothetical protein